MTRALLVFIAMMTAAAPAAQSGGGTGTLAGRVVEANTTSVRAVARASVILDADNGREVLTTTDTEGRFRFDGLPAGRYLVRATKAGWVPTYYGSSRAGRPPGVRVAVDARTPANIEIPMARGAVLAGRILDADGRPMARQFPWLLERRLVGDQLLLLSLIHI